LNGEGFTAHVAQGDVVEAGQTVITYDVPAIEATGRNPIIPVVVMDKKQADMAFTDAVIGGEVSANDAIITTR
ncbi:MAG: PTS glucose transporter subunit IIA, partial [Propionibacterium sp.]|nr:PTS glucose transporter subunit IIA [Propionibacterium sp.]